MINSYYKTDEFSLLINNRKFNERMRTKYFKKVRVQIQKLNNEYKDISSKIAASFFYENIRKINSLVTETLFYSNDALIGYEAGLIPSFSAEHNIGILEEEKIFMFLMEEIQASLTFFEKYISTEFNLMVYKDTLKKLRLKRNIKSGFIDKIYYKIDNSISDKIIKTQMEFLMARVKTLNEIHKIILNIHKYILEEHTL